MENIINPNEQELLQSLDGDIKLLKKELNETVKAIVDGGYSNFPILLAHEEEIAIAQKVIDKKEYKTSFSFSASTMEELVARKIILDEKKSAFEKQFTTQSDSFCILLVHKESMKFIFRKKN
jgi:hypothetical protein